MAKPNTNDLRDQLAEFEAHRSAAQRAYDLEKAKRIVRSINEERRRKELEHQAKFKLNQDLKKREEEYEEILRIQAMAGEIDAE